MHRIRRRTLHAYAAYALLCYVYYPVTEMILIDNSGETIANFSDDESPARPSLPKKILPNPLLLI